MIRSTRVVPSNTAGTPLAPSQIARSKREDASNDQYGSICTHFLDRGNFIADTLFMASPATPRRSFRRIDAGAVHDTILRLEQRIGARFPESGLRRVAQELVGVARDATERVETIAKRNGLIRVVSWLLTLTIVGILVSIPFTLKLGDVNTVAEAIQVLEAALSSSFFIGAAILFLLSLDSRLRLQRALSAIHELRAMAHVVDMHQLTKDPALLLASTPASHEHGEQQAFTPFELERYLDYCSEMLALISKLAVLYVQDFPDSRAVNVVDDIEDLTTGLSRKIWQKIMLIPRDTKT